MQASIKRSLSHLIRENPAFELLLEPEVIYFLPLHSRNLQEKAAKKQLAEADNHSLINLTSAFRRPSGEPVTPSYRENVQNTCMAKPFPCCFRVALPTPSPLIDINVVLNDQLKIAAKLSLSIKTATLEEVIIMSTNRSERLKNSRPRSERSFSKPWAKRQYRLSNLSVFPGDGSKILLPFLLPSNGCGFSIDCLPKTLPTTFLLLCVCKDN